MTTISFDDGSVPAIGFGTFELDDAEAERCTRIALDVGYRHIDTAQAYRNEEGVGRAIAASDVDRDEVFVTTKVWRDNAARDDVHRSTRESLDRLGLDHVDLLLIHWPADEIAPMEETLEALTEVRDAGLTRHIGVSNFPSERLARAFEVAPIVTDQVEHHPYLAVDAIRKVLEDNGGFLTAYSPVARGQLADDPVLTEIGESHGVTPVQVAMRWMMQRGDTVALPRSSNPDRIASNLDVDGFVLSDDEVAQIEALNEGRRLIDPPFGPAWDPS
jgi:diketogulonate reductase-like aldo/keto reductase